MKGDVTVSCSVGCALFPSWCRSGWARFPKIPKRKHPAWLQPLLSQKSHCGISPECSVSCLPFNPLPSTQVFHDTSLLQQAPSSCPLKGCQKPKWQHWSARSKQVTCNFTPAFVAFVAAGEARSWWRSHLAKAESQSNCWAFQGTSFPEVGRQVENLLAAAWGHLLPCWGGICAFFALFLAVFLSWRKHWPSSAVQALSGQWISFLSLEPQLNCAGQVCLSPRQDLTAPGEQQ